MSVKRYMPESSRDCPFMRPDAHGHYVTYADYARLLEALKLILPSCSEVAELDAGEQPCIAADMVQKLAILRIQHPELFV